MGYRSQVYLGVEKCLVEDLLLFVALDQGVYKLLFEHTDTTKKTSDGHLLFNWDYIKWYDEDKSIASLENWLAEEDRDEGYSFIRMGEDFGDVQQHGQSDGFYFYPTQGISAEWDE
jgi:hypothetical protein